MYKTQFTEQTPVICPGRNETFVFTCRDSQVFYLSWTVQPEYDRFSDTDEIIYLAKDEDMIGKNRSRGHGLFIAVLVSIFNIANVTNSSLPVADLVSTLTVSTNGILNGTTITCSTDHSSIQYPLIFAGRTRSSPSLSA